MYNKDEHRQLQYCIIYCSSRSALRRRRTNKPESRPRWAKLQTVLSTPRAPSVSSSLASVLAVRLQHLNMITKAETIAHSQWSRRKRTRRRTHFLPLSLQHTQTVSYAASKLHSKTCRSTSYCCSIDTKYTNKSLQYLQEQPFQNCDHGTTDVDVDADVDVPHL